MANPYEVVLFDLGGVVIELSGVPIWQSWTGAGDEAEVWERWLRSTAVRRFESGRAGAAEFAREIVAEFGLAIGPDEFVREFTSWPKGVYPGVREMIAEARSRVRVGCLSNCNELHWPRFLHEMRLHDAFDECFSSHELGALKPDREVFDLVVSKLGCVPDRVLFLDDNQINVDGAVAAGLHARVVKGPDAVRGVLGEYGLLG
ncbi:MAG: HAD family phosphatase [Candidatus Binatia bacterium]|nr:HAD family phosphatase [Candidatus Binatia bacterium]